MEFPKKLNKHLNKVYIYKTITDLQKDAIKHYFREIDSDLLEFGKKDKYIYIFFDNIMEKFRVATDKFDPNMANEDEFSYRNIKELLKCIG